MSRTKTKYLGQHLEIRQKWTPLRHPQTHGTPRKRSKYGLSMVLRSSGTESNDSVQALLPLVVMITICLIAYLTVTSLFVVGLAFAAGRATPAVPEMQMLQQELAHSRAESVALDKAA